MRKCIKEKAVTSQPNCHWCLLPVQQQRCPDKPFQLREGYFPIQFNLYFLIGLSFTLLFFAFFRLLSQSRRILFYIIEGSLPPSLPVPLLLLCHSFCITFQFLQAFSGHLKSWLTRSVGHVKSWFIIYLRKRLEHSIEQKNAVTCLHLAKSKVKLDRQWWLCSARHMDF